MVHREGGRGREGARRVLSVVVRRRVENGWRQAKGVRVCGEVAAEDAGEEARPGALDGPAGDVGTKGALSGGVGKSRGGKRGEGGPSAVSRRGVDVGDAGPEEGMAGTGSDEAVVDLDGTNVGVSSIATNALVQWPKWTEGLEVAVDVDTTEPAQG